MAYIPKPPAKLDSIDELFRYVVEELRSVSEALEEVESVALVRLHAAPEKVVDGMLVLADGSDWDPGDGAGVYYWDGVGEAWVILG